MAEQLIVPHLRPEEIRVFIADDDEFKRAQVQESLGNVGLEGAITEIATDFDQAVEYINKQKPDELDANVFLLDGSLNRDRDMLWQGRDLAARLVNIYAQPLRSLVDQTKETMRVNGLGSADIKKLFDYDFQDTLWQASRRQLHNKALLIGISSSIDGRIDPDGQIARADLHTVGPLILDTVVPRKVRKEIEAQRRKEEQIAQGDAIRAERAAERERQRLEQQPV